MTEYYTIRMSSDGYGNAQGHYLNVYKSTKLSSLMDDAKKYVENRPSYTLRDIQMQLFNNDVGENAVPNLLLDWDRISQMYPNITIGEIMFFAYDNTSMIGNYPCLTMGCSLPYWDGNKHIWKKAISLLGEY